MDLSIIIPCRNLENYISPMLESLSAQTEKKGIEIVFVLDSCTDNTFETAYKWCLKNEFQYRILNVSVQSCGLARNEGLVVAKGDYIWFMDGDDWLAHENVFKNLFEVLRARPMVPMVRVGFDHNNFPCPDLDIMVWQYIFKRETIGETRFGKTQPHEDREFMKELHQKNPNLKASTYFHREKLYYYNYMRDGSNMHQFTHKGFIDS